MYNLSLKNTIVLKRSHQVSRESIEITILIKNIKEYTLLDLIKIQRSRLI
jgi:hypothetical protein